MLRFPRWWWFAALVMLLLLVAPACNDQNRSDDDSAAVDDDSAAPAPDDDANVDDDAAPTGTKNPIVMVHGFFGWGENPILPYFYHVADDLRARGYEVFTTRCSPVNSMENRAHCLAREVNEKYPGRKINIIAHSQGGLDARYLISTMGWGDRIGAVVMISAPNRGTALADVVVKLVPDFAVPLVDHIMNLLHTDWDGFVELTRDYMNNTFNPANPDDSRVAYYSYAADAVSYIYPILVPTHWLLEKLEGPNDGIVATASARWDTVLGVEDADHWAVIGQPAGISPFDYIDFYEGIAQFLKDQGF